MITKILITGSRDWCPWPLVRADLEDCLEKYGGKDKIIVIHGGAAGVDLTADEEARELGIHVARVDALWGVYYRAAGPVRNGMMLALEPDVCFAYFRDRATSKGTKNMVEQCTRAGITVHVRERENDPID